MALQVWLPLTKDLRNQGLDDITVTTANTNVFQNEGKLSNLSLDVSGHYAFRVPSLVKKRVFSCSFWYKPITNSSYSDNWRRIIVFDTYTSDGSTAGAIFRFESSYGYQSSSTQYCISIHNNVGESIASIGTGLGSTDGWNQWQHITITADGTTLRCYRNGIQIASGNMGNGGMLQGTVHIGYTGNRPIGRLNDFRLYDHCLSPMEVKELSKGLVLHYPLNHNGTGQENLVKGSNTNSTSTNIWLGHSAVGGNASTIEQDETNAYCVKVTRDNTTQSSWDYLSYDNFLRANIKTNTTYTISFDCKPSVDGSISFVGFVNGNATNYMTNSTTTIQGNCIANQWNHMIYQCKTINSFDNITIGSQVVYFSRSASLKGTNVTVLFKNIKVEEGSIATPWCPNSSDTLATTMGLNSAIEYDISGFGNNGTNIGALEWSSNTSKYKTSLNITSDSCARYIFGPAQTQLTDQITLACWLYQTSTTATSGGNSTTKQFALSQGRDYLNLGFNITVDNGKPGVYAGNGGSESGARVSLISTTKTITGAWHHVAATYNNGSLKLYVDGQLDRETTIGALDYVDAPALVIGKMAYGYTNTGSYFPFIGYINDARVYATALSADDIVELYSQGRP